MDGNGRWAEKRGKPRRAGHLEGVKAAKRVVRAASGAGLRFLTLYTFSTENWNRPRTEVTYLMFLIRQHLKSETRLLSEKPDPRRALRVRGAPAAERAAGAGPGQLPIPPTTGA